MRRLCALLALVGVTSVPHAAVAAAPSTALAPVETVIDAQAELVGVAVLPDGTRYVSDRSACTGSARRVARRRS